MPSAFYQDTVEHCLYNNCRAPRPEGEYKAPPPRPKAVRLPRSTPVVEGKEQVLTEGGTKPRRRPPSPPPTSSDMTTWNLEQLRKHAANVLKIVGASKIRGGRAALLKAIEERLENNT
jgi:hypothetical protein